MRIEVAIAGKYKDPRGLQLQRELEHNLRGLSLSSVRVIDVYVLSKDVPCDVAKQVFCDPVIQDFAVGHIDVDGDWIVEVGFLPGVMDTVGQTASLALSIAGFSDVEVQTRMRFVFKGDVPPELRDSIVNGFLLNPLIQRVVGEEEEFIHPCMYEFSRVEIDIVSMDDSALTKLSADGGLSLSLTEMRVVQDYYRRLGRNPTDVELETIAQTWSEHCKHKTFRGTIIHNGKEIRDLFKSTIVKATEEVGAPWCISVFKDNAGVVRFDDHWCLTFKVETHNHPSALEPYGGAGTGIGGVIRDTMGTGLGAKPVASTDVFCFAPLDYPMDNVPQGVHHPLRIARGVVYGVRDYGNRMGIPTVNGAIVFDERYLHNPVVYCGNVGILPSDCVHKEVTPGEVIVLVGGRTGRDGIHGATFSSRELDTSSQEVSGGAVQIGNPIEEKKLLDGLLRARDEGLYTAVTDCGAGGLSSAVGEMGAECGAEVYLEKVPLKYSGLSYTEIWISESQERMVLAVPRENVDRLIEIFEEEGVCAVPIGRFTSTGRLVLMYNGEVVGDLDMDFLHNGNPTVIRESKWEDGPEEPAEFPDVPFKDVLVGVLSHPDVASKEWVIRQYDFEVQGGSVGKPLMDSFVGAPADASVFTPLPGVRKAVIVSCGINPRYGDISPRKMAIAVVDEALRNLICVGGKLEGTSLLDNFAWGDVDDREILGALVESAIGLYEGACGYGVPFISGKDSLHNKYRIGDRMFSIPNTLLVSAIGVLEDVELFVSPGLKRAGNPVYLIGETKDDLGRSVFLDVVGGKGGRVPCVDITCARRVFQDVPLAVRQGLVVSLHDPSDGGLAVALAEMAFGTGLGLRITLPQTPLAPYVFLFSESPSRFVAEVPAELEERFVAFFRDVGLVRLGEVIDDPVLDIEGIGRFDVPELEEVWRGALKW